MTHLTAKRIFITGATGFLGGCLAPRLVAEGAHVVALARSEVKAATLKEQGIETISGDLLDLDSLRRGMRDCQIVIHMAAAVDGSYDEMYPATVTGTQNVMNAAADIGVRRVVHVSSIAVYGLLARSLYAEDTPLARAEYPYITTKQLAEEKVKQIGADRQLEWAIIRPGMIYGPRAGLWTKGLFQLASLRPTPFIGDGSGNAAPIYVDDVVEMLVRAAASDRAINQIFNCVMDPPPTWREFIGVYQRLAQHSTWLSIPISPVYAAAAAIMLFAPRKTVLRDLPDGLNWLTHKKRYPMDKSRLLLGWEPQISLDEGIARCAEWLRTTRLLPVITG
ncbi:MAG: NAD(P)-dependent oxidoreductase [Anaerolineae bacterium]|nr:NAD(P)-dependent oxidoreductase [Anaerolineae bacterium]